METVLAETGGRARYPPTVWPCSCTRAAVCRGAAVVQRSRIPFLRHARLKSVWLSNCPRSSQVMNSTVLAHEPTAARDARPSLRSWPAVSLVSLTAVVFYPVIAGLVQNWWHDPNFSHGFVIPIFSAWVLWRRRALLRASGTRPCHWGLIIVLGALLVTLAGSLGAEQSLPAIGLVLLLGGYVVTFWGWRALRQILFPWSLLFLMVPIPAIILNHITLPLQFASSQLATSLLSALGIPALRQGNVITVSVMHLEVAEACSGIRSLVSLTTLVVMYGYLVEPSWLRRVVLVLCAIPIAVAANALRVFGTGVCVEYWDPAKASGFFHEFSGWVVFMISAMLVLAVHASLRRISGAFHSYVGRRT